MKPNAETHHTPQDSGDNGLPDDIRLHSGGGRRFLRLLLLTFGLLLGLVVIAALGLFLYLQGGTIENDVLNNRIENSITAVLGPQYDVRLGPTKVELRGRSLISVTSTQVQISKIGAPTPLATIGKILVGVKPLSLFNGTPKITAITLENSSLDLKQILSQTSGPIALDMQTGLPILGEKLDQLRQRMSEGNLNRVVVKNSIITGTKFAKYSSDSLTINELKLTANSGSRLNMNLQLDSSRSLVKLTGLYEKKFQGGALLNLEFSGLDAREWLRTMDDPEGFLATDAKIRGRLNMVFNADYSVQQPIVNVRVGKSKLRIGRSGFTNIKQLALNFRLFPKLNRIVMERSAVIIGSLQASIVGAITPVDAEKGLAGDIDYTLVVERAQSAPSQSGEKIYPGSAIIEGGYNHKKKLLNIAQWNFSLAGSSIVGSGSLGFEGETPSLALSGVARELPIAAIKQFWPIFLATKVRTWTRQHVHGGKITSATIDAAIPGGVLGRMLKGKRIADDQLEMTVNIENVRFDTFGEVPPVRGATGQVLLKGMRTEVNLTQGVAYTNKGSAIKIEEGKFTIADIAQRPLIAKTSFFAKGKISSLAKIVNAKPLIVMDRLKMTPGQWSGNSEIDVVAEFPLKKKMQYGEVKWQALVQLRNASSSKRISGRKITKSDVVIDVSPQKAVISGDSVIDGIRGNVLMIEPVGKNSKVKRKRVLKARMRAKDRAKIGLNIAPVITGTIDVVMEQYAGRKAAEISVNLKDAEISLPWIGWRKGAGVPAKASFRMINAKSVTKIDKLKLAGKGFAMKGNLVIDKKGVRSANIPSISLNKGDNLSVSIKRQKGAFQISASGKSFDGRGLVKKLFHQDGVANEQGNATFKLSANIESVKGFGKQSASNLTMNYVVKKGWLDGLSLKADFGQNKRTTIDAGTANKTTQFDIRSQNAGSVLSFLDVYTHMINGKMVSTMTRKRGKPFHGKVKVENFVIVDEPKLKKLVSNRKVEEVDREGRVQKVFSKIKTNSVKFPNAEAVIEKGEGYLKVDGSITGLQIGLTYNGTLYDAKNRMNLRGTFMPAIGISKILALIPIVGQVLSNGKDSALIGITYHLKGPTAKPKLLLNPLSIVAPGIFKKIFEKGPKNDR